MLLNYDKKKLIAVICILIILIVGAFIYFIFLNNNNEEYIDIENELDNKEQNIQENIIEEEKAKIVIDISGQVKSPRCYYIR